MIVYSEKIIRFIDEIKQAIKHILIYEIRLKVLGNRFYTKCQTFSYPISVVIYSDKSMLAYFDPEFYELGFHKSLINLSKDQLHHVIRHELAHYMIYINGHNESAHGAVFKNFCRSLGWGQEVYRSTLCLDKPLTDDIMHDCTVTRKIKKLLALTSSENQHESEQALIKAQQLLLKHNLELNEEDQKEDDIILKRIMKQKKQDAKLKSIAKILETFFINVIFHRGLNHTHLEITGTKINVDIAEYVAYFLYHELDMLWNKVQQIHKDLKGLSAKNSFFYGIAKGYCRKIGALKNETTQYSPGALLTIEKNLTAIKNLIYPHLSVMRSQHKNCQQASHLGEQAGKDLNIHQAIQKSSSKRHLIC